MNQLRFFVLLIQSFFLKELMNINNFIQYISLEKHYSGNTAKAYQNDLTSFSNYIQTAYYITNANEVNHEIVRSWIVQLIEEDKTNTSKHKNTKNVVLRVFYVY